MASSVCLSFTLELFSCTGLKNQLNSILIGSAKSVIIYLGLYYPGSWKRRRPYEVWEKKTQALYLFLNQNNRRRKGSIDRTCRQ